MPELDPSIVWLLGVWTFCFGVATKLLGGPKDDRGRQDLANFAKEYRGPLKRFYERSISLMLSLVDKWAHDSYLARADSGHPKGFHPFGRPSPWSHGLYSLALRLALVYPFMFLFAGWLWMGQAAPGLTPFLPSEFAGWRRGLAGLTFALAVFCLIQLHRARGRGALLYAALIITSSVVGACLCSLAGPGPGAGPDAIVGGAVGGAVFVAATVVVLVVVLVNSLSDRARTAQGWFVPHSALWLVLVGLVIASLHAELPGEFDVQQKTIVIILGLLPLANAPLDWVSLG